MQLLRSKGCSWDKSVICNAQEYGFFDVSDWALENGCPREEYMTKYDVIKYDETTEVEPETFEDDASTNAKANDETIYDGTTNFEEVDPEPFKGDIITNGDDEYY